MIVNQWVPAAHIGDAVGDNARAVRDVIRRLGHESDLFALSIDDALRGDVHPWDQPAARQGDVTILHFAMPSPMTAALATLPGTRVICYHNVTPPSFFVPFDEGLVGLTARGRAELETLVDRVDLALGVSEYNRNELEELGFAHTGVMPLLVDTDRLRNAGAVPALERMLQDGLVNILFVGRIAPNKKIEDHIRLAEHYKRYVDVYYRFIFVGKYDAVPRYHDSIRGLIAEYRMLSDRFWFPGPATNAELGAYYRNAHAYVSLSEHEGFCAPLVESMAMDVPVLAYGAAAVPETLGGAGVCFNPKDLEWAAELLGALVYDHPFRHKVIEGQRRRAQAFARTAIEPRIQEALAQVGV
jgi:glycosyltransferase involved in cell wall biosynthesis